MTLLKGKVAIITGATRGIGKGIALKFAEQGANIAFTYVSSSAAAAEVERELAAFGVKAKGYQSNAGDLASAEELVGKVIEDFENIDIVVNNAGITKDGLLMRKRDRKTVVYGKSVDMGGGGSIE